MCVGGGPAGDAWGSPRRPGKGPERAAGARGPRAALAFRVSLSTKLGSGRWRAPPSGLPVRQRRRPRGLQRGDRAPYLGYWGLPRVPFLKARRRLHKKYAEGGGLLSVEGEINCASACECSFFCVATDVSLGIVLGLLSPKEHGLLKKAAPCKIWGLSPA